MSSWIRHCGLISLSTPAGLKQVRLLFAAKIATYIEERVWHPEQLMRRRADDMLEMEFETTGWKELVRWILSWQPDVEVLSPKRLRERIELKMRQGLANFSVPPDSETNSP